MRLQRIDRMSEPPVPGRFYLVPCVRGKWCSLVHDWPVIGPKHEDKADLDFPWQHYHLDLRFVSDSLLRRAGSPYGRDKCPGVPLMQRGEFNAVGFGAPTMRRRLCVEAQAGFPNDIAAKYKNFRNFYKRFSGTPCRRGKHGLVCPHRNAPLGSVQPDADGMITCPLHGLRIDPNKGVVL